MGAVIPQSSGGDAAARLRRAANLLNTSFTGIGVFLITAACVCGLAALGSTGPYGNLTAMLVCGGLAAFLSILGFVLIRLGRWILALSEWFLHMDTDEAL